MGAIHELQPSVIDQIAAGEVVERPASVLKELLENAIDAQATQINVDVEGAGIGRVRVWDNGHGIAKEDLVNALRRHATSKIVSLDDLWRLRSFGFRGEALASMASVSKVTLTSRVRGAPDAFVLRPDGSIHKTAAAEGTSVEVGDLFYNVPARRKFLKSPSTEVAQLSEVWMRVGLCVPHVSMALVSDGKVRRELASAPHREARVREVFSRLARAGLKTVVAQNADGLKLEAFLGAPEDARSAPTHLHVFVNNRYVRDRALVRAVAMAYGSVMPSGRYPLGVLFLEVPPQAVDVNVHPQKIEVRFSQPSAVFEFVMRMCAHGLSSTTWHPTVDAAKPRTSDSLRFAATQKDMIFTQEAAPRNGVTTGARSLALGDLLGSPQVVNWGATKDKYRFVRALGQIRKLFIVVEGYEQLYILDQHAADERIKFHGLKSAYSAKAVTQQMLTMPVSVACLPQEVEACARFGEALARLGFDCDVAGDDHVTVRAVPMLLGKASPERLIRDALAELSLSGSKNLSDAIDKTLATMACHSAIRAGDALSLVECEALVQALNSIDMFRGHCPHGRPVLYEISYEDLERKLGR